MTDQKNAIAQFEQLLPLAVQWAAGEEVRVLSDGVPLTAEELSAAQALGVMAPERVRLLQVGVIPRPDRPALRDACDALNFLSTETRGLTLGYAILIQADWWRERSLIIHELVHTTQYERLGGIEPFLRQYLMECLTVGYPQSPLEQEAVLRSATV